MSRLVRKRSSSSFSLPLFWSFPPCIFSCRWPKRNFVDEWVILWERGSHFPSFCLSFGLSLKLYLKLLQDKERHWLDVRVKKSFDYLIGVGPGFDSQGSVNFFTKYCFPNLHWIHVKAFEVEDCEFVPVHHQPKVISSNNDSASRAAMLLQWIQKVGLRPSHHQLPACGLRICQTHVQETVAIVAETLVQPS